MKSIVERALNINDQIVEMRRELHKIPEIGMELPKSYKYITNKLKEFGYEPQEVGAYGIVATIGSGDKTIGLRADYDGLPIVEEADVDYKSENGNMHACGHDINAAMLLGAAKLLKESEANLKCRVKLIFQPGEEIAAGALKMIKAGAYDDVDEAYMNHTVSGRGIPTGKILTTRVGPAMASSATFKLNVKGLGGHGSTPHFTTDPINIASHIILNLQSVISREVNPFDPIILSVGKVIAGSTFNIIPETATVEGTVRTYGADNSKFIIKRIKEVATKTAEMFGGECSVEIEELMPACIQSPVTYPKLINELEMMFGSDAILPIEALLGSDRITGSEDFAYVSERIPAACILIAMGTGNDYGLHQSKVTFDEDQFYMGTAAFMQVVLSN